MSKFARLALAGLLAIAAGGIARADDAQKAKIGVLRLSSSAPVFIAQDKGYFREAGLDIELKFFDAAQPIAVAVSGFRTASMNTVPVNQSAGPWAVFLPLLVNLMVAATP